MNGKRLRQTLMPYTAAIAGLIISYLAYVILDIFDVEQPFPVFDVVFWQIIAALPFSLLFLADIPMRWAKDRSTRNVLVKHLTFIATTFLGIVGNVNMLRHLPDAFNSYATPLWFCFGLFFFNLGGASVLDVFLYGSLYLFGLSFGMLQADISFGADEKLSLLLLAFQSIAFIPLVMIHRSKLRAIQHAFNQLEKVFYPHQIRSIRKSSELEDTMPTHQGDAVVICFDIIDSSRLPLPEAKEFFRRVFQRCNALMLEGYNGQELEARAYRIKEMGDGFLCSLGYPFRSPASNTAIAAVQLADEFLQVCTEEARRILPDLAVHCGIGIARGPITGFYPESRPKEYDLFGRSIVLATRYEGMRRELRKSWAANSFLILQDDVYRELDEERRKTYAVCDLKEQGLVIRDDPEARYFYYRVR